MNTERLQAGVHDDYKAEALELGGQMRAAMGRVTPTLRLALTDHAQAAARGRNDNHVGTEHVVLALYATDDCSARSLLDRAGVSKERFESVLDDEAGPSPEGAIPYTPRAVMIGGLAVREADAAGSAQVNDVHLLLGAIAESRRWEQQHAWGPHHLRTALEAAGRTLDDLEAAARAELGDAPH